MGRWHAPSHLLIQTLGVNKVCLSTVPPPPLMVVIWRCSCAVARHRNDRNADFGKPIIAVVNSFTHLYSGHPSARSSGKLVAEQMEVAGGVAKSSTPLRWMMDRYGPRGMLYSPPSRELIADSVEYMVNAHCADAMVCISNCDKITPGMLMASCA